MKLHHYLEKIKDLFDLVEELELLYGIELEIEVKHPEFVENGIIENIIEAQNEANKIVRKKTRLKF